jgi:Rrf2 family nitric oxide-sensitive transcriptional repressor
MFSQTTEYALRAIVLLASRPGAPITTDEIAKATQVPKSYLAKVMQSLVRAGTVQAQRGKHGGFMLARAAGKITVLEVVQVVDPIQRIRECPLGLAAHGTNLCSLHRKLDMALLSIEQAFAETTIGSLLEEPSSVKPLCAISGIENAA